MQATHATITVQYPPLPLAIPQDALFSLDSDEEAIGLVTSLVEQGELELKGRPSYGSYRHLVAGEVQHLHVLGFVDEDLRLLAKPIVIHSTGASDGRPEVWLPKIRDIDWSKREVINMGGCAVIYRIAPGVIAKVGWVTAIEAQTQERFSWRLQSLPVWDHAAGVECPEDIRREVCPVHGVRAEAEILPSGQYICTCDDDPDILLMPEADHAEVTDEEYHAFTLDFSLDTLCSDSNQDDDFYWDMRPSNVVKYYGRVVAIDFGEEVW